MATIMGHVNFYSIIVMVFLATTQEVMANISNCKSYCCFITETNTNFMSST